MTDAPVRLRPHLSLVVHGPDDVELRHGVWNPVSVHLRDEAHEGALARVLLRLDGTMSPAEVAAAEVVPREHVERLVDHLLERDLVELSPTSAVDAYLSVVPPWGVDEASPAGGRPVLVLPAEGISDALVAALGDVLGQDAVHVVPDQHPALKVLADPDTSWLDDGLGAEERLQVFRPWAGNTLVAAESVVDPVRLRVLNRAALRHGFPWVHAALDGPFVLVGPAFLPGETPCYECLETRVFLNLREGASYQRYKAALAQARVRLGRPPLLGPLAGLLNGHLALEVANLALTGSTHTVGRLLALHVPTMEVTFPEVLRVPGCAACGSKAEADGEMLHFNPALLPEAVS